jgi:hypothetical protein
VAAPDDHQELMKLLPVILMILFTSCAPKIQKGMDYLEVEKLCGVGTEYKSFETHSEDLLIKVTYRLNQEQKDHDCRPTLSFRNGILISE